jgi:alpha-L-arabinofuranosidase
MTEEINFSHEGGIYGELIRNRTFKANAQNPVFWNASLYVGGYQEPGDRVRYPNRT